MKKYTLFELQSYLHRVVSMNFTEPLWVRAEVSKSKLTRGNLYLELVQKNEGTAQVCAQARAVVWTANIDQIEHHIGSSLSDVLRDGLEVSLQVEVTYHPVYGLSLSVLHVDMDYTLGALERQRKQTLDRVRKEGLLEKNASLPLSIVPQRIAIISSRTASGYHDFIRHLTGNQYGYNFQYKLFNSALQGRNLVDEIAHAMKSIDRHADAFDCIAIIRGGGSRLDLAGFDLYPVAFAISHCRLPVLTGIGHETDTTVADIVAYQNFKTPTAVAHFLIEKLTQFETHIQDSFRKVTLSCENIIQKELFDIGKNWDRIRYQTSNAEVRARSQIEQLQLGIDRLEHTVLDRAKNTIAQLGDKVNLLDPFEVMKKGYAIVSHQGIKARSTRDLSEGDEIKLRFWDGQLHSVVREILADA